MGQFLRNLRILPGPIFAVELTTTSRRARHFILRVIYGGILLFALISVHNSEFRWQQSQATINTVARFTETFFITFGIIQIMAVLLIGPALVSGTIASERERRTIEYLFTTTLSNLEIILGKLSARLVHIFYLILAGVPVLAMAMLLGGIAPQSIVALFIVTVSAALSVAMVSIAVSTWSARPREAFARAYLVLLLLLLLLPLLSSALIFAAGWTWLKPCLEQLLAGNPLIAFMETVYGTSPMGGVLEPWDTLLAMLRNQMIVAGSCLALAAWGVRRVHLKQSGVAKKKRRFRIQWFRPAVGDRPMLWKEIYAEPAAARLGLIGIGILGLVLVGVLGFTAYMYWMASTTWASWRNGVDMYLEYALIIGTGLTYGALLLMLARSAGCITSEKERDCWDSLLSTPLEGREILFAKLVGNLWSIRGLLVLLAIVWLPAIALRPETVVAMPFLLGTITLFALFSSALGVNRSLWCKNSLTAMVWTLGTALILAGGYLFCCMPFVIGAGGGDGTQIVLAPCISFLLAFPSIAAQPGFWTNSNRESTLVVTYLVGISGYVFVTLVLYFGCVNAFDRAVGRTRIDYDDRFARRPPPRNSPPLPPQAPLEAEILEDSEE